jgi:hypothetical protein
MLNNIMLIVDAGLALLIGVALILIVRQLGALQKNLRAATFVATQAHARDFDHLLVQDENVRSLMRYSRWEAATNVVLHDMEARYQLWREGISDNATWQADLAYINKYANADFVRTALQEDAREFHPDFITYLAGKSSK